MPKDWKGLNGDAFEGQQRQAIEAVSQQLHELSAGIAAIAANKRPGTNALSSPEQRLGVSSEDVGLVNRTTVLPDGTYNDVVISSPGTSMTVTGISIPGSQGDVLYHNGTDWVTLPAGTDGRVLGTQGTGANPRWIPGANGVYVDNVADLVTAVAAGGTIYLAAGTYTLTDTLTITQPNTKLIGAGDGVTRIIYTADNHTDIIRIRNGGVLIQGLEVAGSNSTGIGRGPTGGAGSGRGIVIDMETTTADYVAGITIRDVTVICTASWCIYDTGVYSPDDISYGDGFASPGLFSNTAEHPFPIWGWTSTVGTTFTADTVTTLNSKTLTSAALFGSVRVGQYVYGTGIPHGTYVTAKASNSSITINNKATADSAPTVVLTFKHRTNCRLTVEFTLDQVTTAFPLSGGCLFMGSGGTTTKISGLKTNALSFGSYTQFNDTTPSGAVTRGQVHIFGNVSSVFDNKCIFQAFGNANPAGQPFPPPDVDATCISLDACADISFYAPYFEIGGYFTDGVDWYHPFTLSCTKNSNTTLNSAALFGKISYGMAVSGPGIQPGTYVTGITSTSQITLSQAATDSLTSTLTFSHDAFGYRQYWAITGANCTDISFYEPNFYLTARRKYIADNSGNSDEEIYSGAGVPWIGTPPSGTAGLFYEGYPARIFRSVSDSTGCSLTMIGGRVGHWRAHYSAAWGYVAAAPFSSGDYYPCPENGRSTSQPWDRDDFLFQGALDGDEQHPILIQDVQFWQWNAAGIREPGYPTGTAIGNRPKFRIENNARNLKLNPWNDISAFTGGTESMDNASTRTAFAQDFKGGMLGYVSGAGDGDGSVQREGLWGISTLDHNWKQIPWIRKHTSIWSPVYAGDLWMQLGSAAAKVYTTADFRWYDGSYWRDPVLAKTAGGAATDPPETVTDNAIVRYDGTTGKVIQKSGITIADGATGTLSGTNSGDQTITLTGDVTGSGTGSFAATIGSGKVTYAKIQNTANPGILIGRQSGSAGSVEEITLGTGLSMSSTTLSVTGVSQDRAIMMPPAVWSGGTPATVGTAPTHTQVITCAHNSATYLTTTFFIPSDFNSGGTYSLYMYWSTNGTDTNTISYTVYSKILDPSVDYIDGANDDNVSSNLGPSGNTYEVQSEDITGAINTGITAGKLYRLVFYRDGASDPNGDAMYFLGAIFRYTTV